MGPRRRRRDRTAELAAPTPPSARAAVVGHHRRVPVVQGEPRAVKRGEGGSPRRGYRRLCSFIGGGLLYSRGTSGPEGAGPSSSPSDQLAFPSSGAGTFGQMGAQGSAQRGRCSQWKRCRRRPRRADLGHGAAPGFGVSPACCTRRREGRGPGHEGSPCGPDNCTSAPR